MPKVFKKFKKGLENARRKGNNAYQNITGQASHSEVYHTNDKSKLSRLLGSDEAIRGLGSQDLDQTEGICATGEITLIAHSTERWLDAKREVASTSAENLADEINTKYQQDKKGLKHFNLISCEAGLEVDGVSYAQKFAECMHERGFTNLKVHAMTPPETTQAVTGMIVETSKINAGSNEICISAWCYTSSRDERRDNDIEAKIKKIDDYISDNSSVYTQEIREKIQNLKDEKEDLQTERRSLRLYVCDNTPYQQALILPQNTFKYGEQRTPMPEYNAVAISFLRNYKSYKGVREAIDKLQNNPQSDIPHIILACKGIGSGLVFALNDTINNYKNRQNQTKIGYCQELLNMAKNFFQRFIFNNISQNMMPSEFQNHIDEFQAKLIYFKTACEDSTLDKQQAKEDLDESLKLLKEYLIKEIEQYILENPKTNESSEIVKHKIHILHRFKNYLKTGESSESLERINELINKTNKTCTLWDKGIASRVKTMQLEFEKIKEADKSIKEQADGPNTGTSFGNTN